MSDRRVVLWRHGRTAWNAAGRFQGQLDPPLDDVGRQQAAEAGGVLAGLPVERIVASDLERTRETAAALAQRTGRDVGLDPRLRELDLGTWQGLTHADVRERFPEEYAAWLAGADVRRGGGETYAEVADRSAAAVHDALAEGARVLVAVTHGGTARALLGRMLELDPESWWRLAPLGNCRWSVLVEAGRGWRLEEHNAGELPVAHGGDDR